MFPTLLLAGTLAAGSTSAPEALELGDVLRLAEGRAPEAAVARHAAEAAQADAEVAERLPAPTLAVGIEALPINGADALRLGRDEMTMLAFSVEQMLPGRARRGAGREVGLAAAALAQAEGVAARRNRARAAGAVWIEAWQAASLAGLLREEIAALDDAIAAAALAVRTDPAAASRVLELRTERAALQGESARVDGEQAAALAWLAVELERPVAVAEAAPDWRTPTRAEIEAALAVHPEQRLAEARLALATAEGALARAEAGPEWRLGGRYGWRGGRADMVGIEVGVRIDGLAGSRQGARERAAWARAGAREAELETTRRSLRQVAVTAFARVRASEAARVRLHELIADAGEHAALLRQRYAAGDAKLDEALAASRMHLSHRREEVNLRAEELLARLDLYALLPEWPR